MARIGIFSDTHGSISNLPAFKSRLGQLDSLFHLGDVSEDAPLLAASLNTGFVSVRGNCDHWSSLPLKQIITWDRHKILLLHGHTCFGKLALSYQAEASGCDIVCYGHSHVASVEEHNGILLINPGSLSLPRSSKGPSCAVLTIDGNSRSAEILYKENDLSNNRLKNS